MSDIKANTVPIVTSNSAPSRILLCPDKWVFRKAITCLGKNQSRRFWNSSDGRSPKRYLNSTIDSSKGTPPIRADISKWVARQPNTITQEMRCSVYHKWSSSPCFNQPSFISRPETSAKVDPSNSSVFTIRCRVYHQIGLPTTDNCWSESAWTNRRRPAWKLYKAKNGITNKKARPNSLWMPIILGIAGIGRCPIRPS